MLNRLNGLGHHAVIGGHHQDDDIGHARTPCPHGGKGGVAGSIEKGDHAALGLYMVGTDMLGNATGLARGHLGAANIVE